MNRAAWISVLLPLCVSLPPASAGWFFESPLQRVSRTLNGQIVDYTRRNGADRRLWSEALGEYRDMYVYLPPGFDPCKRYPLMIWLHGFTQDEQAFVPLVAPVFDDLISKGHLPPMIIAAPDGTFRGRAGLLSTGSFFLNSKAGNFEDYVVRDVYGFMMSNYPIRPEREAHILAGVSMGGGSAFNLGIKYRSEFKIICGIFPPVNSRWENCHGRYMANFDPCCWGWKTNFRAGYQVVGRFFGVVTFRLKHIIDPLYNRHDPALTAQIAAENPAEMLMTRDVRPGELDMYIAYSGRDQFNIDAQVESFLYIARQQGLEVGVGYEPKGRHDIPTAYRLVPGISDWLGPRLRAYCP